MPPEQVIIQASGIASVGTRGKDRDFFPIAVELIRQETAVAGNTATKYVVGHEPETLTWQNGEGQAAIARRGGSDRLSAHAISGIPSGVIIADYERAGAVATGSFALETPSDAKLERRSKLQ